MHLNHRDHPMGILESVFLSIPFYFIWNKLAVIYFSSLPKVYLDIPFLHCVGLFVLVGIARAMLFRPRGVSR